MVSVLVYRCSKRYTLDDGDHSVTQKKQVFTDRLRKGISNSYTMGCPFVRGDTPRALASGLSYEHVDKHGITILYRLYKCRPCASRDVRAKVSKGSKMFLFVFSISKVFVSTSEPIAYSTNTLFAPWLA